MSGRAWFRGAGVVLRRLLQFNDAERLGLVAFFRIIQLMHEGCFALLNEFSLVVCHDTACVTIRYQTKIIESFYLCCLIAITDIFL
jgi:hypothetical protein